MDELTTAASDHWALALLYGLMQELEMRYCRFYLDQKETVPLYRTEQAIKENKVFLQQWKVILPVAGIDEGLIQVLEQVFLLNHLANDPSI